MGTLTTVTSGSRFRDRREAGKVLAQALSTYGGRNDVIVLALPRGGVPVAFEEATALHAPLDIFTVRKLGVPGQPELAMGAVASGGIALIDPRLIQSLHIADEDIAATVERETAELHRREEAYRAGRPLLVVRGKTLLLIDDGVATGASMRAAIESLRMQQPNRIVVAVPVGAPDTCEHLRHVADEMVCALTPSDLVAVGAHYENFQQTGDEEVRTLLACAQEEQRKWSLA
jgi:predicted phosphoribosyltransferase